VLGVQDPSWGSRTLSGVADLRGAEPGGAGELLGVPRPLLGVQVSGSWGCRTLPGGPGPFLGLPVSGVLSLGVQEPFLGYQDPSWGCRFRGPGGVQDPSPSCPWKLAPSGPGADRRPTGAGRRGAAGDTQPPLPAKVERREEPSPARPGCPAPPWGEWLPHGWELGGVSGRGVPPAPSPPRVGVPGTVWRGKAPRAEAGLAHRRAQMGKLRQGAPEGSAVRDVTSAGTLGLAGWLKDEGWSIP